MKWHFKKLNKLTKLKNKNQIFVGLVVHMESFRWHEAPSHVHASRISRTPVDKASVTYSTSLMMLKLQTTQNNYSDEYP